MIVIYETKQTLFENAVNGLKQAGLMKGINKKKKKNNKKSYRRKKKHRLQRQNAKQKSEREKKARETGSCSLFAVMRWLAAHMK